MLTVTDQRLVILLLFLVEMFSPINAVFYLTFLITELNKSKRQHVPFSSHLQCELRLILKCAVVLKKMLKQCFSFSVFVLAGTHNSPAYKQ